VLVLRYWHELSEEEIALSLEMTVSAVKSRLHRARLQLAKRWQTAQPQTLYPERTRHESPAF
jgi:RNA polymerase sigma-70 factor (ECF subfamily)